MAQRYRKVEVSTYGDAKFRRLSAPQPNAQTLWLWLLTSERTIAIPGVIVGREAELAGALGWPLEAFREAFQEVFAEGMAEADWEAGLILLPRALRDSSGEPRSTSRPQSPNVIRSWAKAFVELPESPLKVELLQRICLFAEAMGKPFEKAFREAFKAFEKASLKPSGKPSRLRKSEQEEDLISDASGPESDPPGKPAAEIAANLGKRAAALSTALWFEHCDRHAALFGSDTSVRPLVRSDQAFGYRELRERFRVYTDLEQAEADMRHVLDVREAEARKERSARYFGENVWSAKSVSVGLTIKAPKRKAASTAEFTRKAVHPALLEDEAAS